MVHRPLVVAFDVNETLFSLDAIRDRLAEVGAGGDAVERWFAQVLTRGFALTAAGSFVPFRDLAQVTMAGLLGDDTAAEHVMAAFADLEPHPDVRPALERLADADVPAVTLTNGHAETTRALLERAGVAHLVSRCFDVGEVRCWKPAPLPYRHCAQRCDVVPERLGMVAVHSWDLHGAHRAGLVTGFVTRLEGAPVPPFAPPDVSGGDLVEVVERLLDLPGS
ncbi:MAG TPA: haloacid dehalogenase type II [Euzebyales bacterium]|nr:haloacid dehalogenase type II [Euzebyales bacterium]